MAKLIIVYSYFYVNYSNVTYFYYFFLYFYYFYVIASYAPILHHHLILILRYLIRIILPSISDFVKN